LALDLEACPAPNEEARVSLAPATPGICLAGVLPSSAAATFPTPKTQERYQISPALKPAAPEDGRTPLNAF